MKKVMFAFLVVLLTIIVFSQGISAQYDDEANLIYTSKTLTLNQIIEGGAKVQYSRGAELLDFTAELDLFPKDSYRQKIIRQSFNPNPEETVNGLLFKWEKTKETNLEFNMNFEVETQNAYNKIKSKVDFPLKEVPSELNIYLQETDMIDMPEDIIIKASEIASNKDDLFDVAQAIAYWIFTEISYDLSSINVEAQQKASYVMQTRSGVCDESTVLFLAMMRSLGVPARFVSGIAYTNSDLFDERWNSHAWAEVYFPGYGWVPFDLTYAQFGFVDASHIKFKDDVDADTTSTNYNWRSYDIEDIDVEAYSVKFTTTITKSEGLVEDDFKLVVDPLFGSVRQGSYNIITIKVKNEADYYVSSVLNIASPPEVNSQNLLPIYAKPGEEKYYHIMLKVDDLSKKYVYTMPIGIHTTYGTSYNTDFTVSSQSKFIPYSGVEEFIERREIKGTSDVILECNYDKVVFINDTNSINCIVTNNGNTHLDLKLCIQDRCETKPLTIGRNTSIVYQYIADKFGTMNLDFTVNYGEEASKKITFRVVDYPKLELDIVSPENISLYDELFIVANITKVSESTPSHVNLEVKVDGVNFKWDLDSINDNKIIRIPVDTRLLDEGKNKIDMKLSWDHGEVISSKEIILNELTLIEKIKQFFYKLCH